MQTPYSAPPHGATFWPEAEIPEALSSPLEPNLACRGSLVATKPSSHHSLTSNSTARFQSSPPGQQAHL